MSHVRVAKFIKYFSIKKYNLSIWSWRRRRDILSCDPRESYILTGGGYGGWGLIFYYPIWVLIIFFRTLFVGNSRENMFFVIDFDSALPVWLASLINKNIAYCYDIHDDFELRYNFPRFVSFLVREVDYLIKNRARLIIHVDESRIRPRDKNFIVIRNAPPDYKGVRFPKSDKKTFAVTGLIAKTRGIDSILQFAIDNPHCNFLCAGELLDDSARYFSTLSNVNYLGVLNQEVLFNKIESVDFIFSLYDPALEINRVAASNKLYDAIMLGIPVVVNNGLVVSDWVREGDFGVVVNFHYDHSWDRLLCGSEYISVMGQNGRRIYLERFSYHSNFTSKLDNLFGRGDAQE